MKFKVGDRVRAIGKVDYKDLTGKTGTVVAVINSGKYCYNLTVEFDEHIDGHSGLGKGKNGHCRFGYFSEFELVAGQKIVITTDCKKTTAKLYEGEKVVKTASARCNPEDKFDFNEGAKIAFERLMNSEKKIESKYKPGDKVKVIADSCYHFNKIGKVLTLSGRDIHNDRCGNLAWRVEGISTYIRESDFEPYVELYNGKVVCVDLCGRNKGTYTVGKVYQFKDGKITVDDGFEIPGVEIHNFGDWSKFTSSKFIEIKE